MGISFSGATCEQREDHRVWIDIAGGESLSFSNTNAAAVLDALGLDWHEGWGAVPLPEFLARCRSWLKAHIGDPSPAEPARVENGSAGCTVIDCGIPEGYLNRRIHELSLLAAQAREAGATHITWA